MSKMKHTKGLKRNEQSISEPWGNSRELDYAYLESLKQKTELERWKKWS